MFKEGQGGQCGWSRENEGRGWEPRKWGKGDSSTGSLSHVGLCRKHALRRRRGCRGFIRGCSWAQYWWREGNEREERRERRKRWRQELSGNTVSLRSQLILHGVLRMS